MAGWELELRQGPERVLFIIIIISSSSSSGGAGGGGGGGEGSRWGPSGHILWSEGIGPLRLIIPLRLNQTSSVQRALPAPICGGGGKARFGLEQIPVQSVLMRAGDPFVDNSSQASLQCGVDYLHLILGRGKLGQEGNSESRRRWRGTLSPAELSAKAKVR